MYTLWVEVAEEYVFAGLFAIALHIYRTQAIARDLVETIRRNVTIDWTVKESVKANLRRLVKRLLRKYGYPPEKQEKAMVTVLQQAELLCRDWAA